MFKGGRFWTLHLADLGLMTMLQVADMVWEFPFNWYPPLISGKASNYLKCIHVGYPSCATFVAVVVHLCLLLSDISRLRSDVHHQWWCVPRHLCSKRLVHGLRNRNTTAAYLGWGMYHTMWLREDAVENAGFAWDLQVKNDNVRETKITFENRSLPKEHFISHQFIKGELLVSGRRVPRLIAIIAGLGSSWHYLNVVQAESVYAWMRLQIRWPSRASRPLFLVFWFDQKTSRIF